ncbi:MAG TPA: hypothetical protein VEY89_02615 [Candidatus Dormibacteraeota bacterium]|nr:hypothetical protein [Candidatus Dormibacteraeota bacterium]
MQLVGGARPLQRQGVPDLDPQRAAVHQARQLLQTLVIGLDGDAEEFEAGGRRKQSETRRGRPAFRPDPA